MIDSWEDWDVENIAIPVLHVPNKEQIKQLEERKLIEESDIALMNEFFNNKSDASSNIINIDTINTNKETNENKKNKPKISKQKENELKQKAFSQKLKQKKEQDKKHAELFGEIIYDEYDEYDKYN
jgi:hypothetical protein